MSLRSLRTTLPFCSIAFGALALAFLLAAAAVALPSEDLPIYLRDRGTGVPTSLVGTYVRGGELLVYPFYEYTVNKDQEYKPAELGYGVEHDYTAKRTDHEALLFLAYGITKDIGVEFESALWTTSTQHKASADTSAMPSRLKESGFGDTQAEIRWRWVTETPNRPELFTYFEAVFPFQQERVLIGTQEWELVPGIGLIKGFGWGTLTGRDFRELPTRGRNVRTGRAGRGVPQAHVREVALGPLGRRGTGRVGGDSRDSVALQTQRLREAERRHRSDGQGSGPGAGGRSRLLVLATGRGEAPPEL